MQYEKKKGINFVGPFDFHIFHLGSDWRKAGNGIWGLTNPLALSARVLEGTKTYAKKYVYPAISGRSLKEYGRKLKARNGKRREKEAECPNT